MQPLVQVSRFLFSLILCTALVVLFFAVIQDILIFPGLISKLLGGARTGDVPDGVTSHMVPTSDGKTLEVWELRAVPPPGVEPKVAIIFHGNGAALDAFFFLQEWFKSLGITSYGFDYRGYGKSSGWPSERGIYLDSDAVWQFVTSREAITPENVIILGNSIGSAPGAYIASRNKVGVLLLIAPFTSLTAVVKGMPFFNTFTGLLKYSLPTDKYVQELDKTTRLIMVHGKRDTIVPYHHSEELAKIYRGPKPLEFVSLEDADHNDIFVRGHKEITSAIQKALQEGSN